MSGRFLAAVAVAAAISAPFLASAQAPGGSGAVLDTMVVTATRTLERLRDVPQFMEVVTEEEIKASGAKDITDILEEHGVQVNYQYRRNYGNDTVTMRGFGTSTHGNDIFSGVQILVNGRRAGSDSLSIMGIGAVERIEIIHGPGSVMYGSAGMGGVINIITKRGKTAAEARAEVGIGSFGMKKASISGSGTAGKFDIAAAMSISETGDYRDGEGDKVRYSGIGGRYGYYLNAGYNIDEFNRIGVMLQGNVNNNAERPGTTDTFPNTNVVIPKYRGRPFSESQDKFVHSADLVYEGANGSLGLTWLARYYYGQTDYGFYRNVRMADNSIERVNYSKSKSEFQGAQVQVGWDYGILHMTGGVDWYSNDMSQTQFPRAYGTSTSNSVAFSKLTDIGAFLLVKLSLLENRNLVIQGGVRHDKFDVDIEHQARNDPWKYDSRSYTKTIPSFGVAYSPVDFFKLRANIAEAFRVPTPRNLIGNFFMGNTLYIGNPDLEPEEVLTWDVGFDVDYSNLLFSGTYFSSKFKNFIGTQAVTGGTRYTNIPNVTISGIEVQAKYNVGKALGAQFDLTPWLGWTRLLKMETPSGEKLASLAEDTFAAGIDFNWEEIGLKSRLKAVYYGKEKIETFSSQRSPVEGERGGTMIFDFSLTKRVVDFGDRGELGVTVTVENLFNKLYTDVAQVEMPGRDIYVGLVYSY
jgi:vitamin B12 transporter